jgi:hypothetical protein
MNKGLISFQEFVAGYNSHKFTVLVDNSKAGDFVLSQFADKHNKPAHLFFSWLAIALIIPAPIVLWIFYGWIFALGSFILGLAIRSAAKKSAVQFVMRNMLENEDFWEYVLLHKGAEIQDKGGNEIGSEFLNRMVNKSEGGR